MNTNKLNQIPIIYQTSKGGIELKGDIANETLWATQAQIVELFEINVSNVSRHLKRVFESGEIEQESNLRFTQIANSDKQVKLYSLDVVLSVGYRASTNKAINFRKWANSVLKSHITEGFSINKSQISKNYDKFMLAIDEVKLLLPNAGNITSTEILDLVKLFADTWFSLDSYDKSTLPQSGATKKSVTITTNELGAALEELKKELIAQKQATELFAQVRQIGNLQNIVSNVFQSFGGEDLYPTLELKAANLLYFVIKNHPFVDGNKRSGAFAFIWFLNKAGILDKNKINPQTLTALTILIAESDMKDKERMVGIVLLLLRK